MVLLMVEILFWSVVLIMFYIYLGYPFLVRILGFVQSKSDTSNNEYQPTVSLIISAFNEQNVITEKLANSLSLNYPHEKFEIWVVSDASTDGTDELVRKYNHPQVKLFRLERRRGKTYGITEVMKQISSEIVIFSDANAIYDVNAIYELVRYFDDPSIGYVVGNARYSKNMRSRAGEHENTYWSMEIRLKLDESRIGSVVGGDGAIYAIRRSLFIPLAEDDINDFVNPIQIILQGYRGLFNPRAVCYEHAADTFLKEYHRKRRIVNRSWRGLWKNAAVLNPFKTGIYAWQIFSHKLLRWLGGFFSALLFIFNLMLINANALFKSVLILQLLFYALALFGYLLDKKGRIAPSYITMPYYFVMVNLASLQGIFDALTGKTYTTWQTIRA